MSSPCTCLSHGRVAVGHWLDFPCFSLEFPIDKSAFCPSLARDGKKKERQPLQSYLTSWFIVKCAVSLTVLSYINVSSHQRCCMCEGLQFCCKKVLIRFNKHLPEMFFRLLCTHTWPECVSVSYFIWVCQSLSVHLCWNFGCVWASNLFWKYYFDTNIQFVTHFTDVTTVQNKLSWPSTVCRPMRGVLLLLTLVLTIP